MDGYLAMLANKLTKQIIYTIREKDSRLLVDFYNKTNLSKKHYLP